MPKYLGRAKLTAEGLKGLREEGAVNRRQTTTDIVAGVGGTQENYYFAFGDDDLYGIFDLPDDEAAAALSIAANSSGATKVTMTKLLTAEQVDEAFKRTVDYRPPGR
jgi:uncharacterized protein with GYD domain